LRTSKKRKFKQKQNLKKKSQHQNHVRKKGVGYASDNTN